jgi:hypothetical protein
MHKKFTPGAVVTREVPGNLFRSLKKACLLVLSFNKSNF